MDKELILNKSISVEIKGFPLPPPVITGMCKGNGELHGFEMLGFFLYQLKGS